MSADLGLVKGWVGYQHAITKWIEPMIGDIPLASLTLAQVDGIHAALMDAGLSRSSWVQVRTVLKQSLDLGVRRGYLSHNPAALATQPGRVVQLLEYLSVDESRLILGACGTSREKVRWLLALSMGLRQGEVLGLRWADKDGDVSKGTSASSAYC